ncbi:MAG: radical SAM protein [Deferrisomatales bacterium]
MGRCGLCGRSAPEISRALGVCRPCLLARPDEAVPRALEAHRRSRAAFGLPETEPKDPAGIPCRLCVRECRIPEGGVGYCGLRRNDGGRLRGVGAGEGKLSWYHDPLPTNCVGDWVCPGGTGAGYPRYAYCPGPERGYKNLAVFFHACSFHCLFCQNWSFLERTARAGTRTAEELAAAVDERTSCICFFGGDPAPQAPFSLRAARLARRRAGGRILRVCWETNGSVHPALLDRMVETALESGGTVKFDLKAWAEPVHRALTGATNRRTLENFARAGRRLGDRPVPPVLLASTLLVPGYVEVEEVRQLARFVASIDPSIPYSLLAFHPHFRMADLPMTSRRLAERCLEAARGEGLGRVRLGNVHLLA